ncbi:MAG TPA: DNA-binding protein [Chloroflexi bacterium]|nr:DNA-binding protein [Chloroflexota bacterium]
MTHLTITISEEHLLQLKEKAKHFGVTPEELIQASIKEMLTRPEEAFQQAMDYVLTKNRELYQRLASTPNL